MGTTIHIKIHSRVSGSRAGKISNILINTGQIMIYNLYFRGSELSDHASASIAGSTDVKVWQVRHAACSVKPKAGDRCIFDKFIRTRGSEHSYTAINTQECLTELNVLHIPTAETIHSLRHNSCTTPNHTIDYVRKNRMAKIDIEMNDVGACSEPSCNLIADNMSLELSKALAIVLVSTIYEFPVYQGPMSRTKAPLFEIRAENIDFEIATHLQRAICSVLFEAPRSKAYATPVTPLVAAQRAEAEARAQERLQMRVAKERMAAEFQKTRAFAAMQRAKARCDAVAAKHSEKADELAAAMAAVSATIDDMEKANKETYPTYTDHFPEEELPDFQAPTHFPRRIYAGDKQLGPSQGIPNNALPKPTSPRPDLAAASTARTMEQDSGDDSNSGDENPWIDPESGDSWIKSF